MSEQQRVKQIVKVTETETTTTTETTWSLPQPITDAVNNLGFLLESSTRLMDAQLKLLGGSAELTSSRKEVEDLKKVVAKQEQTIRDLRRSKSQTRQPWKEGQKGVQSVSNSVGEQKAPQWHTTSEPQPAKKENDVNNEQRRVVRSDVRINTQLRDQMLTMQKPADAG